MLASANAGILDKPPALIAVRRAEWEGLKDASFEEEAMMLAERY